MEKNQLKHLNRKVAITVALLSTFLALCKVKDDNIVQSMMQAKTDSVDTWNEYQSKKLKDHLSSNALVQNEALIEILGPKKSLGLQAANAKMKADLLRYASEETNLMAKAKELEKRYDQLNYRDDQFDLTDACLSISLFVLAAAALVGMEQLLWMSWAFGAIGMLFGIAAFLGWPIHPDWIVGALT